jgi:hypothetical protein
MEESTAIAEPSDRRGDFRAPGLKIDAGPSMHVT